MFKKVGRRPAACTRLLVSASIMGMCSLVASDAAAGNVLDPVADPEVLRPKAREFDWSGFYVGGTVGYTFGQDDDIGHTNPAGTLVASPGTLTPSGTSFGLRFGWRNWLPLVDRKWVYAFELGYDTGSISDSFVASTHSAEVELENAKSFRLKSGITSVRGNTLYYSTLGYVRGDLDYAVTGFAGGDLIDVSDQSDRDGFLLGLGVEHNLNDRLSLVFEVDYTRISSYTLTDSDGSSTVATPSFSNVRLGLNYNF
ncbi:MAG: outer membrane protein [Ruegeria sp.]|uniref:outer membrane protein n=1 Tax=Ruegeria sp. TaxID=1879320 RepID=UPI00349E9CC4